MFETVWSLRKYYLRDYDSDLLHAAITNWAKRQGLITFYRSSSFFSDGIRLAYMTLLTSPFLLIHYEMHTLFVFTSNRLPSALANIHQEVIIPHVAGRGGAPVEEAPLIVETLFESPVKKLKELPQEHSRQPSAVHAQTEPSYVIHLQSDLEVVEATAQVVSVPPGVSITVTRSRTVEHTVNVNWTASADIDVGLRSIITASIHGKIEQVQGNTYQQSETITYDVELEGGDKGRNYKLAFFDAWRKGVAEVQRGNQVSIVPFQFRERAELKVIPLESNP
jgi:hypothetical protein